MKDFADWENNRVKFTFDSRVESEHNAGLLYAHIRESHPDWQARLADEILFVSSRGNIRIQIADLFAREAMKVLDNQVGPTLRPPRRSWQTLKATGRFQVDVRGHKHFEQAKKDIPAIDSVAKMSDAGYEKWLQETGRVWNLTNYLVYLTSKLKGLSGEERSALSERFAGSPEHIAIHYLDPEPGNSSRFSCQGSDLTRHEVLYDGALSEKRTDLPSEPEHQP